MTRLNYSKACSVLVLILLFFIQTQVYASNFPENLLRDPSFELNVGAWGQWTYSGSASVSHFDGTSSLFETHSGSIRNATGNVIINQGVGPISPSEKYIFSGWVKSTGVTPTTKVALRLIWYQDQQHLSTTESFNLVGNFDWTFIYMEAIPGVIPANANRVLVACAVVGEPGNRGTVFFDGMFFGRTGSLVRPQAPQIQSSYSHGTVELTWEAVSGPLYGYYVYEGETPNFKISYGQYAGVTTEQKFIRSGLERRPVYYKVVAIDQNYIPSHPSNEVKDDTNPPLPVSVIDIDDTNEGVVVLRWQVPEAAQDGDLPAKYNIYRSLYEENVKETADERLQITETDEEFSIEPGSWIEVWYPTPGGTRYYYVVTAVDYSENESSPSPTVSGCPEADLYAPLAPEEPEAYATTGPGGELLPRGVVVLQWKEPGPAPDGDLPRFFLIYRSEAPQARRTGRLLARIPAAQQPGRLIEYRDNTAVKGITYYYLIVSVDKAAIESENTEDLIASPLKPATAVHISPADEVPITSSEVSDSIDFLWEKLEDPADTVLEYCLEYSMDQSFKRDVFQYKDYEIIDDAVRCSLPLYLLGNGVWYWRVKTVFESGVVSYSSPFKLVFIKEDTAALQKGVISYVETNTKVLRKNSSVDIFICLNHAGAVTARIFNLRGQVVKELVSNEEWPSNQVFTLQWKGDASTGRQVPDGLYIIQVTATAPELPPTTALKRVQVFR